MYYGEYTVAFCMEAMAFNLKLLKYSAVCCHFLVCKCNTGLTGVVANNLLKGGEAALAMFT